MVNFPYADHLTIHLRGESSAVPFTREIPVRQIFQRVLRHKRPKCAATRQPRLRMHGLVGFETASDNIANPRLAI